jgi:hypothetical protein
MILVLYFKSMSCLVLQVGPLYVYIYSPERLNNTSIIFRQSLSPTLLQVPTNPWEVTGTAAPAVGKTIGLSERIYGQG